MHIRRERERGDPWGLGIRRHPHHVVGRLGEGQIGGEIRVVELHLEHLLHAPHGGLGRACRAARVDEELPVDRVLVGERCEVRDVREVARAGQQWSVDVLHLKEGDGVREFPRRFGCDLGETCSVHESLGIAVLQEGGDLMRAVTEVERHRDDAYAQAAGEGDEPLGSVLKEDRDLAVARDAQLGEQGGEARGGVIELGVRERALAHRDDGGEIRCGQRDPVPEICVVSLHGVSPAERTSGRMAGRAARARRSRHRGSPLRSSRHRGLASRAEPDGRRG